MQLKIVNWLKAHVYTSAFQKSLKVKLKPANSPKDENGITDGSDTLQTSDSELPDHANVKSAPSGRITTGNIRILKDNKVICSSDGVMSSENGIPMDKVEGGQSEYENSEKLNEAFIPDATVSVILSPSNHRFLSLIS